jgi:glycosyltransferase involved in cell wall biosynthesis
MDILLSVVVPTYKRPQLITRCLNALCAQSFNKEHYEIIVVDDGDHEQTRQVVYEFSSRTRGKPAIRYMRASNTQGPAAARNVGWRAANGKVIAFTDDDTIPEIDWLENGWQAIKNADAVAGHIHVPVPKNPTDYEKDAGGLHGAEFATANCFVTKNILANIGGFDERFKLAWREDSDLLFNLLRVDAKVARAEKAIVLHPVRPGKWGVSIQQQKKVLFDALLFKKHPSLYRKKIRSTARGDYYLIVLALIVSIAAFFSKTYWLAGISFFIWLTGTLYFCLKRLSRTSRRAAHVIEMVITSMIIPPLATFWRLVGVLRFKVLFL